MKKFFTNIFLWIKVNKVEFALLVIILAIGAFLRLYRIGDFMTFLGDEGRDAIIVRNLLVHADPILIGPGTSVGDMYLGPLYYYFMAPGLLLANFSPVGPAVEVAILGVITIWFVWYVTKKMFGAKGALISAIIYAISPTIIIYSRSSWNPNIMPFFALLAIFSIWKIWAEEKMSWFWVLGVSLAFVLQSHYLGLLLLPTVGLFWLLTAIKVWNKKEVRGVFIKCSVVSLLAFILLMSPLVIFDARHGWRNFGAMNEFFRSQSNMVSISVLGILNKIPALTQQMVGRLLTARNPEWGNWFLMVLAIPFLVFAIVRERLQKTSRSGMYFILTWIGLSLIGLSFYKQEIYDHYLGFLFPAPFILLGGLSQIILNYSKKWGVVVVGVLIGFLIFVNLKVSPVLENPNGQEKRAEQVAAKIIAESEGKPFNLAVIANQNYEDGYQYFLEKGSANLLEIDPQNYENTVAEQLFVVCELTIDKCQPTSNPKAQIANFGWSKIDAQWEEYGVILYRLVHNK